jgi:hypothetical protein
MKTDTKSCAAAFAAAADFPSADGNPCCAAYASSLAVGKFKRYHGQSVPARPPCASPFGRSRLAAVSEARAAAWSSSKRPRRTEPRFRPARVARHRHPPDHLGAAQHSFAMPWRSRDRRGKRQAHAAAASDAVDLTTMAALDIAAW